MPATTTKNGQINVSDEDLAAEAIPGGAGGGGGSDYYDCYPGTRGALAAAPDLAAVYTFTPSFEFASLTVIVTTADLAIRVSQDNGGTYGPWIVLPYGGGTAIYDIPIGGTDAQIAENVDAGGALYQIVALA